MTTISRNQFELMLTEGNNMILQDTPEYHVAVYITKMFKRITKSVPIIRLNGGIALYPLSNVWLTNSLYNLELFCQLVFKAMSKYPEVQSVFVLHLMPILKERMYRESAFAWYHGYFMRVCEEHRTDLLQFEGLDND